LVLVVLELPQLLQVQILYLALLQVMAVVAVDSALGLELSTEHPAALGVAALALEMLVTWVLVVLAHQDKVMLAVQVKTHLLIMLGVAGVLQRLALMVRAGVTAVAALLLA
jgi:hypothetical protein